MRTILQRAITTLLDAGALVCLVAILLSAALLRPIDRHPAIADPHPTDTVLHPTALGSLSATERKVVRRILGIPKGHANGAVASPIELADLFAPNTDLPPITLAHLSVGDRSEGFRVSSLGPTGRLEWRLRVRADAAGTHRLELWKDEQKVLELTR